MNNPQELDRRLTLLAESFAPKIEDATQRQQFRADMEQLKRNLSYTPSTEELHQRVVSDLTERLNSEENERARGFIERQMQSLQAASGEELEGRLERYRRFDSFRQLRELQQKYDIPRETYTDAGLPSMGRERRGTRGGDRRGPGGRAPRGG
jgi:GTP1/Obg family GTP-binding protein